VILQRAFRLSHHLRERAPLMYHREWVSLKDLETDLNLCRILVSLTKRGLIAAQQGNYELTPAGLATAAINDAEPFENTDRLEGMNLRPTLMGVWRKAHAAIGSDRSSSFVFSGDDDHRRNPPPLPASPLRRPDFSS
jgi:hypothetical protein